MKPVAKAILFHVPKILVLCGAFANLVYINSHRLPYGTISFPAYTPWYEGSDLPYHLVILVAAVFLFVNKTVTLWIAGILSGYVAGIGFVHLFFRGIPLAERWHMIQLVEGNLLLAIETQWIFAGIVFAVSISYLAGYYYHKRLSQI